jgi:hypothetical protein
MTAIREFHSRGHVVVPNNVKSDLRPVRRRLSMFYRTAEKAFKRRSAWQKI